MVSSSNTYVTNQTLRSITSYFVNTTFYVGVISGFLISTLFGFDSLLIILVGYIVYKLLVSKKASG